MCRNKKKLAIIGGISAAAIGLAILVSIFANKRNGINEPLKNQEGWYWYGDREDWSMRCGLTAGGYSGYGDRLVYDVSFDDNENVIGFWEPAHGPDYGVERYDEKRILVRNESGQIIGDGYADDNGENVIEHKYEYDQEGRLCRIESVSDGEWEIQYEYDQNGKLITERRLTPRFSHIIGYLYEGDRVSHMYDCCYDRSSITAQTIDKWNGGILHFYRYDLFYDMDGFLIKKECYDLTMEQCEKARFLTGLSESKIIEFPEVRTTVEEDDYKELEVNYIYNEKHYLVEVKRKLYFRYFTGEIESVTINKICFSYLEEGGYEVYTSRQVSSNPLQEAYICKGSASDSYVQISMRAVLEPIDGLMREEFCEYDSEGNLIREYECSAAYAIDEIREYHTDGSISVLYLLDNSHGNYEVPEKAVLYDKRGRVSEVTYAENPFG